MSVPRYQRVLPDFFRPICEHPVKDRCCVRTAVVCAPVESAAGFFEYLCRQHLVTRVRQSERRLDILTRLLVKL